MAEELDVEAAAEQFTILMQRIDNAVAILKESYDHGDVEMVVMAMQDIFSIVSPGRYLHSVLVNTIGSELFIQVALQVLSQPRETIGDRYIERQREMGLILKPV